MKCNNFVVYRDAKNGSKKPVPHIWFSPEEIAKGAVVPEGAIKCDGDVKVTGIKPHIINDGEVDLDIHYACGKCKAPLLPRPSGKLGRASGVPAGLPQQERLMSVIQFNVETETWLTSASAQVKATVEVSSEADIDAVSLARTALAELSLTSWIINGIKRTRSKTRRLEWSISVESRVPKEMVMSISKGAPKASSKDEGVSLAITINGISHTPTRAEFQQCYEMLRGQLYTNIKAQCQLANSRLTPEHRNYEIDSIEFHDESSPQLLEEAMYATRSHLKSVNRPMDEEISSDSLDSNAFNISTKVVLAANVRLLKEKVENK